ncbi:hypothetical protein ACNFU2_07965 [Chryseobacterium sp. PTM-20240506]|uniref:hypothetical protein n=1 Tax=Chryseobacterium sp. PTM-20240506 TaxID=3400631 RepID=UPI003AB0E184
MKNALVYYIVILMPLLGLLFISSLNSVYFVIYLFVYVMIYRPVVDIARLKEKNIHVASIKSLIPFYLHVKYFKQLYT